MNLDEVGVCCLQINNNVHKFRTNDSGRPISRRRNIISGPKNETKKKMKTKVEEQTDKEYPRIMLIIANFLTC